MRAYERLLNYVKIYTTSDEDSTTVPSTARQFDLAKILVEELKGLGVADAHVDDKCYVYGTIPATAGCEDKKGSAGDFCRADLHSDGADRLYRHRDHLRQGGGYDPGGGFPLQEPLPEDHLHGQPGAEGYLHYGSVLQ